MIPAATREGLIPFREYSTWFRVSGDLSSPKTPLVVVHGGPGCTHDYVLSIAEIANTGRPVIHYDQLGSGRSTHLRDKGGDFWTVELFLEELENLLAYFDIADRYFLLGQSWGGMLGAEHAITQPAGLRALVISNSPASMALWLSEAKRLRSELPPEVEEVLDRHEARGTLQDPEYLRAADYFYAQHVCRVVPNPAEVEATNQYMREDSTVYNVMNGPNEFHVIGTMRDWSVVDQIDRIIAPTLLVSGRYDEATPAVVQPFMDKIPDVRWVIFEESSHMPFVEEPEAYFSVVEDFLAEHD
ncbi:MAG: proline iminopeptidase-family hydrolase [Actinomycetota bacterium]|jgi:L-proline amide hydrolase|nr:proline iminopeptidase-family hydrolase [Actinomycetota bacterium]